jgi:hypothetical protein
MESLKATKTKLTKTRRSKRGDNGSERIASNVARDEFGLVKTLAAYELDPETRTRIKPESKEARAKRLAARKARTLKAFQTTFENRSRKAS